MRTLRQIFRQTKPDAPRSRFKRFAAVSVVGFLVFAPPGTLIVAALFIFGFGGMFFDFAPRKDNQPPTLHQTSHETNKVIETQPESRPTPEHKNELRQEPDKSCSDNIEAKPFTTISTEPKDAKKAKS